MMIGKSNTLRMPLSSYRRVFRGGSLVKLFAENKVMPDPHHHNVWCSMVRVLNQYGWITKIGKIKPTCKHTHIHEVTEWESNLPMNCWHCGTELIWGGGVSPLFARCPDGGVSPDGKVYE